MLRLSSNTPTAITIMLRLKVSSTATYPCTKLCNLSLLCNCFMGFAFCGSRTKIAGKQKSVIKYASQMPTAEKIPKLAIDATFELTNENKPTEVVKVVKNIATPVCSTAS